MNRAEERKKAAALNAVDVRDVIRRAYPDVIPLLTPVQVDQLQRGIDVATINADIEQRGEVLDQRSIKGKIIHSSSYLRDPTIVAERDKVLRQRIAAKLGENVVRLEFHRLVTPTALKPTSDNPDEAAYLLIVADVYLHRGVWLMVDSSAAAIVRQMSVTDPRKWRARLLLGYRAGAIIEEITSDTGKLDRRALLSASKIGAGYYGWVDDGPTMRGLKRALKSVQDSIAKGRDEHYWWSAHRGEFPVVSKISDAVGGADWPNEAIWDMPHKIHIQALNLVNEGKLGEAAKYTLLASYQAQWCGKAVAEYIQATLKGASRVKSILEVIAVIGEIAEAVLLLWFAGEAVFRLLTRKGATLALEGGAQRQLPSGSAAGELPAAPAAPHLPPPAEPVVPPGAQTVGYDTAPAGNLAGGPKVRRFDTNIGDAIRNVRRELGLPPLPAGTVSQLHYAARGARADLEFMEWLKVNPNAPWPEKFEKMNQINERWRVRGMPGEE